MINIKEVADNADMIINGYAFTCEENSIRVLNLNNTSKAFIKKNYKEMYKKWSEYSKEGFYRGE